MYNCRASAREIFAREGYERATIRTWSDFCAALKSADGWKANWATFAELGLLAAPLPEEYGGLGGGPANGPETTTPSQSVLAITTPFGSSSTFAALTDVLQAGAYVMVTNNNFTDNFDAAMAMWEAALPDSSINLSIDVRLANLGGDGKRLSAVLPAHSVRAADPSAHAFGVSARTPPPQAQATAEEIEIRPVAESEVEAVSRLLYANYGLSYGHPDFYREDWFAQQLWEGRVLSTVAVHHGQVVGHHALLLEGDETAGETGVAVVHPAYRGLGLGPRLFGTAISELIEAYSGHNLTVDLGPDNAAWAGTSIRNVGWLRFYEQLGFTRDRSEPGRFQMTRVLL